jgi:hypothetical protein
VFADYQNLQFLADVSNRAFKVTMKLVVSLSNTGFTKSAKANTVTAWFGRLAARLPSLI